MKNFTKFQFIYQQSLILWLSFIWFQSERNNNFWSWPSILNFVFDTSSSDEFVCQEIGH